MQRLPAQPKQSVEEIQRLVQVGLGVFLQRLSFCRSAWPCTTTGMSLAWKEVWGILNTMLLSICRQSAFKQGMWAGTNAGHAGSGNDAEQQCETRLLTPLCRVTAGLRCVCMTICVT
jgi:hypothetical protein